MEMVYLHPKIWNDRTQQKIKNQRINFEKTPDI